jgi:uncharacterized protein (DUF2062 family)
MPKQQKNGSISMSEWLHGLWQQIVANLATAGILAGLAAAMAFLVAWLLRLVCIDEREKHAKIKAAMVDSLKNEMIVAYRMSFF